ncbi:MAG: 4-hydroxybutyrate CoA-transferase [Proteobacteria bacterium]|nr:4-hydroxybutyrate CoA-transferase [Pseudomonadota bacterium]
MFIPGLSRFDYAALHESAHIETIFANPAMRASFAAGKLALHPLHYSAWPGYLARHPADLAVLHLPPARNGVFSCGLAADTVEDIKRYAKRVAVLVNPELPFTLGGVALRAVEADAIFDAPGEVPEFPSETGDAAAGQIAASVAGLVSDGDCVQIGIGKVPAAILRALKGHRNLSLFGGMIVDEVVDLAEAGALAPGQSITTGIAVGSKRLHAFSAAGRAAFRGIAHTHSALEIAKQKNFISINSAIEVDLFGAINCESVKGRPISGVGGGTDYMRGARLSEGGRSVIALVAEAKGISRIVPRLEAGATSVARADIDILVTEFGIARLRDLSIDARAEAIISIAAPDHRTVLTQQWQHLRAGL